MAEEGLIEIENLSGVLLEEMENWPTYYPANLTGRQIAQEIVAH